MGNGVYYVFISSTIQLDLNKTNVHLIKINTDTALKRIHWDGWGLRKWLQRNAVEADVLLSLQNTSFSYNKNSKKFIYIHQGIVFHPQKWSLFKKRERALAFYRYVYPFFIFLYADKNTKYIVQTEWMKNGLCRQFNKSEKNVLVIKPDNVDIQEENIKTLELPFQYTLFYPATSTIFKNHIEIIYALNEMKGRNIDLSKIGVYFTTYEWEDSELLRLIHLFGLKSNICFLGPLSYDDVLVYYKSCTTVVFPSYIESFGLPLIEAARLGKPLIALDAEYSREVIENYPGVLFAPKNAPLLWMDAVLKSFTLNEIAPYHTKYSTNWSNIIQMLNE